MYGLMFTERELALIKLALIGLTPHQKYGKMANDLLCKIDPLHKAMLDAAGLDDLVPAKP